MAKLGFSENRFEQRFKGGKGVNSVDPGDFQAEERAEDPEALTCLVRLRNSQ